VKHACDVWKPSWQGARWLSCVQIHVRSLYGATHLCVFHAVRLPSVGLQQHQSASLAVYALCPSSHPAAPAVAQLLVAACLAPCLPEAAAADAVGQPLVADNAMQQDGYVLGVQHASPPPDAVLSAPASGADLSQPMDSPPRHQPPSPRAAAAQHNTPPDKAFSAPAVPAPSAEAVAKYHGAAQQTHVRKDAAPAPDVGAARARWLPADCAPVDVAIQVTQKAAQQTASAFDDATAMLLQAVGQFLSDRSLQACTWSCCLLLPVDMSLTVASPVVPLHRWCPSGQWRTLPAQRCGQWRCRCSPRSPAGSSLVAPSAAGRRRRQSPAARRRCVMQADVGHLLPVLLGWCCDWWCDAMCARA
jgi:hypothetical protein